VSRYGLRVTLICPQLVTFARRFEHRGANSVQHSGELHRSRFLFTMNQTLELISLRLNRPHQFSRWPKISNSVKMLSPPYTQELYMQLHPLIRSIRCDVCFSQVMRFLCELSPRATMYELNWPAISLLGGELALPNPGGPRQPL